MPPVSTVARSAEYRLPFAPITRHPPAVGCLPSLKSFAYLSALPRTRQLPFAGSALLKSSLDGFWPPSYQVSFKAGRFSFAANSKSITDHLGKLSRLWPEVLAWTEIGSRRPSA